MNDPRNGRLTIAMMIETVGLGGAEQVVYQLSDELRSRGHTVHPVVPAGHEGWLLERFREGGFKWQTYSHRYSIALGLPRRMAAMFRELGVSVVHSHEFAMAVYGTAAARVAGVRHVITLHADAMMTTRLRRRIALRWAFRLSDATVAVSHDTKQHLDSTLGLRPGTVQVVHNGIPARPGNADAARASLGIGPSELLLLGVGSLIPRKGFDILIRALAAADRGGSLGPWRLAIAGKGAERASLEALARECGLENRVTLLGPRNDIPDLQEAADIFVMPSLWEGLPIALLEAMFAGTTIVASNTSGIPEAVEHDKHAALVAPGSVEALTQALVRVMTDAPYRARLGQAAQQRARTQFTIAAMTNEYERIYR